MLGLNKKKLDMISAGCDQSRLFSTFKCAEYSILQGCLLIILKIPQMHSTSDGSLVYIDNNLNFKLKIMHWLKSTWSCLNEDLFNIRMPLIHVQSYLNFVEYFLLWFLECINKVFGRTVLKNAASNQVSLPLMKAVRLDE